MGDRMKVPPGSEVEILPSGVVRVGEPAGVRDCDRADAIGIYECPGDGLLVCMIRDDRAVGQMISSRDEFIDLLDSLRRVADQFWPAERGPDAANDA